MAKPKEKEKAEEQAKEQNDEKTARESQKEKKRGFVWMMIRENIQDVILGFLLLMGFKKPSQVSGAGGQIQVEKQIPGWFLSAFPNFTREDENEYNLLLDSHPDLKTRIAAEEFEEAIRKDDKYDEVKYVVNLVQLRREFMEQLKHPAPRDDSGGRLSFEPITLRDPILGFFNRILEEKNQGGSQEEIYARQIQIAIKRKLLPRKHWVKRILEHKLETLTTTVLLTVSIFYFLYLFLDWILA